LLPELFKSAGQDGTSQGEDAVGAAYGPFHGGLFEAMSDEVFASGLDDAGTDE